MEETQPQPEIVPEPAPIEPEPIKEQPSQVVNVAPRGADVITIGDRAYAKNVELTVVNIPEGIVSLGSSAFANCINLTTITLPSSLKEIGFNCFFNTPKLTSINYSGTLDQWKSIKRGLNWLTKSGTRVVKCLNGQMNVNPNH